MKDRPAALCDADTGLIAAGFLQQSSAERTDCLKRQEP